MRHRIYFFITAVLTLGLLGCESKGFRAEREMWRANKLARAVYKNPGETPPYQVAKAQDAYRAIIKKYPDSFFVVQSKFGVGHLYLAKGQFDKAREEYKQLTVDCDKKADLCAKAYFVIGKSYEAEGRWDDALADYRKIMQDFPFSSESIDIPLYLIGHYQRLKDENGVKSAVNEATAHYQDLSGKPGAEKSAYLLQGRVVRAYLEGGQWQDALDYLDKIAAAYPNEHPEQAFWLKAMIYAYRLNDKPKVEEELQKIVRDYPRSKLVKAAEEALRNL